MAPLANKKECWGHNLQIFSGLQISKPKKFNFVSSVAFGYLTSAINQKTKKSSKLATFICHSKKILKSDKK